LAVVRSELKFRLDEYLGDFAPTQLLSARPQYPGGSLIINGQDPQGAMFSLVSNKE
jgi:hypothetical protein